MSYRLPPLNGLKAFEAAGRHLSFKQAAVELSVTPGAVSQQVKQLEQSLGVPLFRRLHRSLVLTAHGEAYLPVVVDAFHRLSEGTDRVARTLGGRVLRLGVSPELGGEPQRLLAGLRPPPRLSITDDVADLLAGGLDALLRPAGGRYPGMHAETLMLVPAFARREASLIVWPGFAGCRELTMLRTFLSGGAPSDLSLMGI
jgi:LysR family glycine cleavage system transcriptional activator